MGGAAGILLMPKSVKPFIFHQVLEVEVLNSFDH